MTAHFSDPSDLLISSLYEMPFLLLELCETVNGITWVGNSLEINGQGLNIVELEPLA